MKKKTILLLSVFLMFGCNTDNIPTKQTTSLNALEKSNIKTIKGQVQFPKTGFSIKSKFEDVAKDTTVSLIYPSDHVTNANKIISTGLTDSSGLFTLNPDFSPTDNEIFVLEAVKRTGGAGNSVMTIRTHLKWSNSNGWSSITGSDVYINNHTTALAIIDGYDNTINSSDTISKISMSSGVPVATGVGGVTASTINEVSTLVDSVLYASKDPFAVIKFVNSAYQIDHSKDIEQLTLNNNCSGCSLVGMNLSNTSLAGKDLSYADLRGLNLANQDLSDTILIGADLRGASLPDDLSYLNLSEIKLTGNDLRLSTDSTKIKNIKGTNFSYADMTEINLSGTGSATNLMIDITKGRWTGVNFNNSKMRYVNAKKVHFFEALFNKVDVRDSDFSQTDLTGVDMSHVINKDTNIPKDITNLNVADAILTGANFSGMDMRQLKSAVGNSSNKLGNAVVTGINLENSILQGIDLSNKNFFQANLKGANFQGTSSTDGKLLKANFRNANLSGSNLSFLDLSDLNFTNCDLSQANLNQTRIIGTDFTGSNLQSSTLTAAFIQRAKFVSADMRNLPIDPATGRSKLRATIADSDFSYADMSGLVLRGTQFVRSSTFLLGCNFTNTNFTNTVISNGTTGVNFSYSNLTGVNFENKDIRGSSFESAILTGANFTSVNAKAVSFINAFFEANTTSFKTGNYHEANFLGSSITSTSAISGAYFYDARWWNNQVCKNVTTGKCVNSAFEVQP